VSKYLLAVIFGTVVLLCGCGQKPQSARPAAAGPPVTPVSAVKAVQESVPTEVRVVGTAEASAIVQVKSQIAGELTRVALREGQDIAKGDLLFEIDPRPYEEAVRQADAAMARDRAQIAQAEAALVRDQAQAKYAESDAARQGELYKENLASRMQADQARTALDVALATAKATQATVETARATLQADLAALAKAKLDLSYCEIRSPIAGRTGNVLVQAGNQIKVSDVPLVVIHRISPIYVNFSVPEQHLPAIRRLSANGRLPVQVIAQDDATHTASGYVTVVDNAVDANTGTIHLKALLENRDRMLWPGEFVTTVLTLDTIPNAILVPTEAVQAGQRGQFVYVVTPKSTVEMRPVSVGIASGARTVIREGVAAGDTVVTDGQLRLFPGAPVKLVDPGILGTGPL
jgi:multidrug efflux system membrane fusion protein